MYYVAFGFVLSSLVATFFVIEHLLRRFKLYRYPNRNPKKTAIDDLPSVSVCIPARNEMHVMAECLERVCASDYEKLEIIVLDDSSVDDTSVVIKSFAHAGVRFVEGSPLPAGWLGKAHAQQVLYDESSGDVVLYIDVDTHIKKDTISKLVDTMMLTKADMISVMPVQEPEVSLAALLAPLRYLWVLLTDRTDRPAAVSSAWIVRREFLKKSFDGFRQVRLMIEPERAIAAEAANQGGYRFYTPSRILGISEDKSWHSKRSTSIRLLFPQFGGRLLPSLLIIALLSSALLSTILPLNLFVQPLDDLILLALVNNSMIFTVFLIYCLNMHRQLWLLVSVFAPVLIFQEIVFIIYSIISYMTRSVTWKGRPVRLSALHVSRSIFHDQGDTRQAQH